MLAKRELVHPDLITSFHHVIDTNPEAITLNPAILGIVCMPHGLEYYENDNLYYLQGPHTTIIYGVTRKETKQV